VVQEAALPICLEGIIFILVSLGFFTQKKKKRDKLCDTRKPCVWVQKDLRTYLSE
jgi:hypothetical protein